MTKVRADRTVIVIGVFLFILGLAVAWNGYGYVRDERGWTLVISGTVVFSSGLLLVALGLVLRELRAIAASAGRATLLLAKAKTLQIKDFDEDLFPAAPPPVPAAPPPVPMAPPPLPPRAFEPEAPAAAAAFAPVEEEYETPAEQEMDWKAERALRLRLPRVDDVAAGAAASRLPNPLAWMVRPEKPEPVPPPAPRQTEEFELVAGAGGRRNFRSRTAEGAVAARAAARGASRAAARAAGRNASHRRNAGGAAGS